MKTNKYFQVRVDYLHKAFVDGDELHPNKPETYLVDAMSFTEAEARIIQEITPRASNQGVEIQQVTKTSIAETYPSHSEDKWFKAKVGFLTLDNDKEKRTPLTYLIQAADFSEALQSLQLKLHGIMSEYDIISISETPILEVFDYIVQESDVK